MLLSNASIAMIVLFIIATIITYFMFLADDKEAENQQRNKEQKMVADRHKKLREMKNNRSGAKE